MVEVDVDVVEVEVVSVVVEAVVEVVDVDAVVLVVDDVEVVVVVGSIEATRSTAASRFPINLCDGSKSRKTSTPPIIKIRATINATSLSTIVEH